MTAKNTLIQAPPYPVEQAIKRLGANLRTARLRRNLTIAAVGEKIASAFAYAGFRLEAAASLV